MARILLIDDDDLVRRVVALTLVHFGHTVFEACDGKQGLAQFASADPDLVVTDIVMPGMDGLEVLMELRKRQPPVKIIAISGGGRVNAAGYLHTAKSMGAAKVLTKPFSSAVLIAAVDELLQGSVSEAQEG